MFVKSVALLAAVSLATSPAFAQASALSTLPAVERTAAPTEIANELEGGGLFPAILFATIVLGGVLLATGVLFDDDDDPISP